MEPHDQRVHYLGYHPVVHEDAATTKVRIVMDASAKITTDAPSLNECLYTGPSLTRDIIDINSYKIQVVQNWNCIRFWKSTPYDTCGWETSRFIAVVMGAGYWFSGTQAFDTAFYWCSPFHPLKHHISKYQFDDHYFAEKLLESIHVDHVINDAETPIKSLKFLWGIKSMWFRLRKWKTFDKQLQALIDKGKTR